MITGAAGLIGSMLRERWRGIRPLVLVDRAEMAAAGRGETVVRCDVADAATMRAAMTGVDAVVHLAGVPTEAGCEAIRDANIEGCYQTFEAARLAGVRRIVLASSNHAIGFHDRATRLDGSEPVRPDTRDGVSKVFGEALARYYADKFGLSAATGQRRRLARTHRRACQRPRPDRPGAAGRHLLRLGASRARRL